MSEDLANAIVLERYKYVLERRKQLNENTFKIASIFQAICVLLASVQIAVLDRLYTGKLAIGIAKWASDILLVSGISISVISVSLIVGGVAAWVGYRNEESEICTRLSLPGKDSMKFWQVLSWYETYILIVMIGVPFMHWLLVRSI